MTRRLVAGLAVVASVLPSAQVIASTGSDGVSTSTTQSRKVVAAGSGSNVTVSGWATFSGAVIAGAADKTGDAGPAAAAAGADIRHADLVYRPELADLFVRIDVTSIPTIGPLVGEPTVLYGLRTVVDGVPIDIRAQSAGATARFGLFDCRNENGCTLVAPLKGGYGTTGESIVVDLPLSVLAEAKLHLKEGDKITTPVAYAAHAPFDAGAVADQLFLDDIALSGQANVTIPVASVRVTVGPKTERAALHNGYFKATFPRSLFHSGRTPVKTRTCLGSSCRLQRFEVKA